MSMVGIRAAALVAAFALSSGLHAAEVAGIQVEEKVQVGRKELALNGAGLRSKFFVKVYVGALYLGQKATSPAEVYAGAPPRRMVLRMLRNMDADSLHAALDEGLRNNLSPAEFAELKPRADQLGAIMKEIGAVKEGDSIAIDFTAHGVDVGLNGKARGKVDSAPLALALLKVWLGDNPADASLKKALLGG